MKAELRIGLLGVLLSVCWHLPLRAEEARDTSRGATVYVVHVDAHEAIGDLGALEAGRTVLALADRLRTLSSIEQQVFGAVLDTKWQIIVSAGQGEFGTLVARIEPDQELASAEQLGQWISSKIVGAQSRSGFQVSLWPLQQLVAQLAAAEGDTRHQLIRLVSSSQEADLEKNSGRLTLLRKRVEPFAAAIDLDMAPLRLETEGWRPIARSRIPFELTANIINRLVTRINTGVERWGQCDRVLIGSSLVDVLVLGESTARPPAEVLKASGQISWPTGWDFDVGRLKFVRIDPISGLGGLAVGVSSQANLRCRFDSRAQPSWEILRDGQAFSGDRVFRSERLLVRVKTVSELSAEGLGINVTREEGQGERLCGLGQALKDGCSWQPTKLGTHTLTLVEPSGAPWEILTTQRKVEVVAPAQMTAAVTLTPGICPGSDKALPFEDQSFPFSAPDSFCVDYRIELSSADFDMTPEQKIQVLSSLRVVLAKGEQLARSAVVDPRTGQGQVSFSLPGDASDEDIRQAGAIVVKVVNSRGPSVFRDPVADLTFEVAFGGGYVTSEFELSDKRTLFWGLILAGLVAMGLFLLWIARRTHHVELLFRVRGWSDAQCAVVKMPVSASDSEHEAGLRPVLGLSRIGAKRIWGGYQFRLDGIRQAVSQREQSMRVVKAPVTQFEWGPFNVDVKRTNGSGGDR